MLACVERVQMGGYAAGIGMKRGQKIGLNLPHASGQLIFNRVEFNAKLIFNRVEFNAKLIFNGVEFNVKICSCGV